MKKMTTNTLKIKTLSVNQAWQGRRFKTKAYKDYEKLLFNILPDIEIPKGELKICFEFGFSNKASDIDNPTKPLLDIFQKKYGFNDKLIYSLHIDKKIVCRGEEYFSFSVSKR